jgi:sulfide:quinone oxidoreductase
MTPRELDSNISVTPQISLADVETAANLGFKTIFANRPDGEEYGQVPMAAIEEAATAAGLKWVYQPVVSGQLTQKNVDDFAENYRNAEKPILAFCRTGTRCTILWGLSNVEQYDVETLVQKAEEAGYDLSGLRGR